MPTSSYRNAPEPLVRRARQDIELSVTRQRAYRTSHDRPQDDLQLRLPLWVNSGRRDLRHKRPRGVGFRRSRLACEKSRQIHRWARARHVLAPAVIRRGVPTPIGAVNCGSQTEPGGHSRRRRWASARRSVGQSRWRRRSRRPRRAVRSSSPRRATSCLVGGVAHRDVEATIVGKHIQKALAAERRRVVSCAHRRHDR